MWDLSIRCSFSLLFQTLFFILILVFSSWTCVTCVCCCDRDKLRLLVIILKTWLIMLSSSVFFGYAIFIADVLLKKEKTALFLELVLWWELMCRYWPAYVGFLYSNTWIFPLFRFNKVSRNASSALLSSSIVNLMF